MMMKKQREKQNQISRYLIGVFVLLVLQTLLVFSTPVFAQGDGTLKVMYLDVGQADSILIKLPDQRHVLIDGGNREDSAEVQSYLKAEKVKKVDFLVATHPHEDHIGGLPGVVDNFEIGQVIMPKVAANTKIFESLLKSIKAKGLSITPAKAGAYLIYTPNLKLQELAPAGSSYSETNDYSVVLKLTYKSRSFLFTGDAEGPPEDEMIKAGYDLKSDVLKVGHHGGRTSTSKAFLTAVQPELAIIMVGKDNDYGHPHSETLARLKGIKVLRTDLNGTVILSTDGADLKVKTERAGGVQRNIPQATPKVVAGATSKTPSSAAVTKVQVFVTKSGKRYHVEGCTGLSHSKIPMTLDAAKKKGYGPCNICHPLT